MIAIYVLLAIPREKGENDDGSFQGIACTQMDTF